MFEWWARGWRDRSGDRAGVALERPVERGDDERVREVMESGGRILEERQGGGRGCWEERGECCDRSILEVR